MPKAQDVVKLVQLSVAYQKAADKQIASLKTAAAKPQEKSAKDAEALNRALEKAADAVIATDSRYKPSQRPEILSALSNPEKALNYLAKIATERQEAPSKIGTTVKAASDASSRPGSRSGKSDADAEFARLIAKLPTSR